MRRFGRDVRFALRGLLRRPGFALAATGTLALGIAASVTTFSIVDAVLLRALPYEASGRLVAIWETRPARGADRLNASPADFVVWRDRTRTLDAMAGFTVRTRELTGLDEPARLEVVQVTRDFFGTLGLDPGPGRPFQTADYEVGSPHVAILGHDFWQTRLGGDPGAVGRRIRVDGIEHVVVGVMPPAEFDLLGLRGGGARAAEVAMWTPLVFDAPGAGNPIGHWLTAVGRLAEGTTLARARTEMAAIAAALERERPDTNEGWGVELEPLRSAVVGDVRPVLLLLSGAVALVLLIACTNVANLLLIRSRRRRRELAIRTSLGADRRDLAGHLLAESTLLAIGGGVAGVLLAAWALEGLRTFGIAGFLPRGRVGIDGPVLLFALGLSLGAAWGAALVPICRSTAADASGSLRVRGPEWEALRGGWLAVTQVALSLVLVVSAGLLIRSLSELGSVDPGFRTDGVVVMDLTLSPARYPDASGTEEFFRRALEEVAAVPGVERAGAITRLPLATEGWCGTFVPLDRPRPESGDAPCAEYRSIRGEYFGVMGIPILEGRGLRETDDRSAPGAMVIGETMADRFWPRGALGARVAWGDTFEVVGIAGDVRHFGLDRAPEPQFYVHQLQDPNDDEARDLSLVIRAATEVEAIVPPVRSAIRGLDPNLPIQNVRRLDEIRRASVAGPRARTIVLSGFGAIALALSILGTYAVLGYHVAGRMREMAIRMAMGARRGDLVELVLLRGLRLVAIGLVIGAGLTWPATSVLSAFLFRISPADPLTLLLIALLFALAGLAACSIPALRASRADPAVTLRLE